MKTHCYGNFDSSLLDDTSVNLPAVLDHVKYLSMKKIIKQEYQVAWLLRAITCIDLTSLSGDDCSSNIQRLCEKAVNPISEELLAAFGKNQKEFHTGAVCVYPAKIAACRKFLQRLDSDIPIAAVATGFPSGQYHLETRLQEINCCIEDGATEIDIVINRDLALCGKWEELYYEVKEMRKICDDKAHLKTILAVGELGSLTNVYKASMVCMLAGADFIKTSTGKENFNASLPVGVVMGRAINDYYDATGYKVGFKPAGGIKSVQDALMWQMLMKEELGSLYLFPDLFRIGASGLLSNIEKDIYHYVTSHYASNRCFRYI